MKNKNHILLLIFISSLFYCSKKKASKSDSKEKSNQLLQKCDSEGIKKLKLAGDIPCADEQNIEFEDIEILPKTLSKNRLALEVNARASSDISLVHLSICPIGNPNNSCSKSSLSWPENIVDNIPIGTSLIELKYCVRDCTNISENMITLEGYKCKNANKKWHFFQDKNSKEVTNLTEELDILSLKIKALIFKKNI